MKSDGAPRRNRTADPIITNDRMMGFPVIPNVYPSVTALDKPRNYVNIRMHRKPREISTVSPLLCPRCVPGQEDPSE